MLGFFRSGIFTFACRSLCAAIFLSTAGFASVIAVGADAFPSGSPVLAFQDLANGTEVNGLRYNGVLFTYSVSGTPLNGAVSIDDGPGTTNHITPPNIVSVGNNTGTLTLDLPATVTVFGYGYAILASDTVANATTISLFSGTTPVGTLSYTGVPDPGFTGGFAGIQSTIPFDTGADLQFDASTRICGG